MTSSRVSYYLTLFMAFLLACERSPEEGVIVDYSCGLAGTFAPGQIGKVIFLGNSITHSKADPSIGWYGDWGMAASAESLAYLAILTDSIRQYSPETVVTRASGGVSFERNYHDFDPEEFYKGEYQDADLLVVRLGENVADDELNSELFAERLEQLVDYYVNGRAVHVLIVTSYWPRPRTTAIMSRLSAENGWCLLPLDDLYGVQGSTARSRYPGTSIGEHPSDFGMVLIADRMWSAMRGFFVR